VLPDHSLKILALMLLSACSSGGTTTCPEPFYDGKGSDEAWRTMQDGEARATKDDAKAVTMAYPLEGDTIPRDAAPRFRWSSPLIASGIPLPARTPSMLSRLSQLVYSSAWAHLPPVTGPIHLLRISVPMRACPIEVLTTRVEWTPSDAAWTQLKDTGAKPLTLDVFSAYLQENRISEGPFHLTKTLTFSVAP
jgi:hypothetical protein